MTPPRMRSACALAALSGALYTAAEPGVGLWPLAFVCLAPLALALCGRDARQRAGLGWLMGTTAALGTIGPTVYASATLFFGLGPPAALLLVLAVGQLFAALPIALFAWLAGDPLGAGPLRSALRLACAWTAQELLRTLCGLPWAFLAHALAPVPALLQAAGLGGAFLVSFWLAAWNAALGIALATRSPRPALATAGAVAALVGAHAVASATAPPASGPTLRARLVQPQVPEAWRGSPAGVHQSLDRLAELTRGDPVDLAVWPENAVSVLLPVNDLPLERGLRGVGDSAAWIVLGAPRVAPDRRFRNSAFLVSPRGGIAAVHDKVHLVPFAEALPLSARWLGLHDPGYVPGDRPSVLSAGAARLGPLVCYEVIFPELARDLVRQGANVLVNVSNDYWLGGPGGGEQHLAAAVLRAVEVARPLLRATNTGITAAIDARGRILARLPRGVPEAATVTVQLSEGLTLYARTGDAFAWLAAAAAVLASALEQVRRAPR